MKNTKKILSGLMLAVISTSLFANSVNGIVQDNPLQKKDYRANIAKFTTNVAFGTVNGHAGGKTIGEKISYNFLDNKTNNIFTSIKIQLAKSSGFAAKGTNYAGYVQNDWGYTHNFKDFSISPYVSLLGRGQNLSGTIVITSSYGTTTTTTTQNITGQFFSLSYGLGLKIQSDAIGGLDFASYFLKGNKKTTPGILKGNEFSVKAWIYPEEWLPAIPYLGKPLCWLLLGSRDVYIHYDSQTFEPTSFSDTGFHLSTTFKNIKNVTIGYEWQF